MARAVACQRGTVSITRNSVSPGTSTASIAVANRRHQRLARKQTDGFGSFISIFQLEDQQRIAPALRTDVTITGSHQQQIVSQHGAMRIKSPSFCFLSVDSFEFTPGVK